MRVFVTGATGALGRHLVPWLVAAGHEVTATTKTPGKVGQLREAGATPAVLDGLDGEAVIAAVRAAAPEVMLHEMTALADMRSLRNMDRVFAATNELRTLGTDNLLAAAAQAGTRRVIAQSAERMNQRSGGPVKTERILDARPVRSAVETVAAIRHVEQTVPMAVPEGIVLRYGTFYGPGASQPLLDMVRKRQMPVIGGGTGIWSFIEMTDAAAATAAAVGAARPASTTSPTATRRRSRTGCHTWPRSWAPSRRCTCGLAWAAARRGVRGGPDDQRARVLEREGQEGTRLGAAVRELAGGIPCLGQRMRRARSPTGSREIRALPTFHPAFLLRSPLQKRFAWRDFLALKKALAG